MMFLHYTLPALLVLYIQSALSHPQCNDFAPPFQFEGKNMFCDMYKNFTCCSGRMDSNIKKTIEDITPEIEKLGLPDCVSLLKQVACQECSPYAAHVYETEGGGPKKVLPGLCNNYCSELYSKCEEAIPLLTQNQDVLDSLLSSKSDFCKLAELNDDIYCYPELLTNPVLTLELKRTTDSKDGCICLQEFASGIGNPLLLMSSDDLDHSNLVYVGVQAGIIYMYEDGKRLNDVFLDITDKVLTSSRRGDERGFFGLAFHTDFKKTQKFYVHYTHLENFQEFGIVSEFKTMKGNLKKADKESEKVILKIRQPWSNHNGGSIIYSHDGFLYVFLGDGGSGWDPQNNGQNLKTLLGSVLRINVDTEDPPLNYSIPKDNPFVEKAGRDEIWAYGVRNPFRATEDRGDPKTGEGKGRIFMADVGQNMWEEVDILEKGGNYGWKIKEGPRCLVSSCKGFVEPIAVYNHNVGRSIIGGYVYRGCESPNFNGLYIYGDYTAGDLFRLKQVNANQWQNKKIDICGSDLCFNGLTNQYQKLVLSFGEDYDGELYVLTSDTAGPLDKEGKIYKLVDPRRRGPPSSCRSYREPVTTKPVLQEPTKKPTTKKPRKRCDLDKKYRYPGLLEIKPLPGQKCKRKCRCKNCSCKKLWKKNKKLLEKACKSSRQARRACCTLCKQLP